MSVGVLRMVVRILSVSVNRHFRLGQSVSLCAAGFTHSAELRLHRITTDRNSTLEVGKIERRRSVTHAIGRADDSKQSSISGSRDRRTITDEVSCRRSSPGKHRHGTCRAEITLRTTNVTSVDGVVASSLKDETTLSIYQTTRD